MSKVSIKLEGAQQLSRKLSQLPRRVQNKVLRQALRAGMRPIHRAAQENAPVDTGLLRRSVKLRAMRRRRGVVGVQVQTTEGNFKGKAFYGAFQEFGYKRGNKQIPGKHFMERAAEQHKDEAVSIVTQHVSIGVVREAKAI